MRLLPPVSGHSVDLPQRIFGYWILTAKPDYSNIVIQYSGRAYKIPDCLPACFGLILLHIPTLIPTVTELCGQVQFWELVIDTTTTKDSLTKDIYGPGVQHRL